MTFFDVEAFVTTKQCKERQRFGRCNCVARKAKRGNPCDRAQAVADYCKARGLGEPQPNGVSLPDVIRWVHYHRCHKSQAGRTCPHSGCEKAEAMLSYLEEQQATEERPRDIVTAPAMQGVG